MKKMGYELAVNKAWEELDRSGASGRITVKFMADEYSVDVTARQVISLSCNIPAKDFTCVIILHYLAKELTGLPELAGEWLTFRELSGVEGYEAAFKKRVIDPIIRKYGRTPEAILGVLDRLPAKRADGADLAVMLEVFRGVPVLIKLWRSDEEFAPGANLYFDASARKIFCIEDMVVLAGIVVSYL